MIKEGGVDEGIVSKEEEFEEDEEKERESWDERRVNRVAPRYNATKNLYKIIARPI